jgi:hypothetical protein
MKKINKAKVAVVIMTLLALAIVGGSELTWVW